jgi:hypothetical protein
MHHHVVTPEIADEDHRLTLERAFEALPETAPESLRRLRRAALRKVALRAIDAKR